MYISANLYAYSPLVSEDYMATQNLKRKTFFVDEEVLRKARKALRARTSSEAIRTALERVTEMEEFWRFMNKSRAALRPGSVDAP
jgi:hypothetical protein